MTKKLRQVATENPSVDFIRPGKEKAFARLHKVLKTSDANGNDDEVFKGSKVKVAPRPGKSATPDSSPKDSYGKGHINNYDDKNTGRHEETVIETRSPYGITPPSAILKFLKAAKKNKSTAVKNLKKAEAIHSKPFVNDRVKEETEVDEQAYNKSAVNKEIKKDKRIGGKEGKLIHRLLRGRTTDKKQDHTMGSIIRKEEVEVNELSDTKLSQYIAKVPNDKGNHNKGIKRAVYRITQGKPKYKLSKKTDLDEGRKPHPPLKGHPYHEKSDAELHYIIKDAGEAAHAMRDHSPHSEGKYLDQVNDASTVLGHRRRGGHQVVVKKNEETITELFNRTLHSYIKKAKTQRDGAARMSNTTTKGSTLHKSLKGLVKQRNNGISNATHKIASHPNRYAEETVNEITKERLSVYVAKAGSATGKKLDYTPFGKRSRGITQATKKLTKEDLQNDPGN